MKIDLWHTSEKRPYLLHELQMKALASALTRRGVHVRHIEEGSHDIRSQLQRLWTDPPDWTVSLEYALTRAYGLKDISVPHMHILSQECYPLGKTERENQFFAFPYPSDYFLSSAISHDAICVQQQGRGVAFLGNYRDEEAIISHLADDFSPYITAKILEAGERNHLTPEKAFDVPQDSPYLMGVNRQAIVFILDYLAKARLAKKMLEAYQEVALYGSSLFPPYYASLCSGSWKSWMRPKKGFTYHGPVPASEVVSTMQKYALILDPTPPYLGVSVRLLQALAAGCEVVTYHSPLVEQYFGRGAGVHYFGEPPLLQNVAQGQEIVKRFFTWDTRVEELLDALH